MISTAARADGTLMVTEDLWFPVTTGVGSSRSLTQIAGLSLAGVALLGFAMIAARRRRDSLDGELAGLLDSQTRVNS